MFGSVYRSERRRRGRLFGGAPAAAAALGAQAERRHGAGNVEHFRVLGAGRRNELVDGQAEPMRLQMFLEARLGVLALVGRRARKRGFEQRTHGVAARRPAAVEIDRGDERLERVGKDRIPTEASALQFAGAETQLIAELELARDARERGLADQARAQPRELALVGLREPLVEQL